jgi:membrane protein implicated in regulation of membrane protease activity
MNGDKLLAWVLVISTFLVGGKALGLLDISWLVAFGPVAALMIVTLVLFIISCVLMYTVITKKEKEDGDDRA